MPLLVLLLLVLLTPLLAIALMPVALVFRYRAGTARRPGRHWVTMVNAGLTLMSALFLLIGSAVTTLWVPGSLQAAATGLVAGAALGLLGLVLSRWEHSDSTLHFTPNRWLVLAIMLLVSGRLVYGIWRGLHAWWSAAGDASWIAAAGIPGSLAAGGVVLGYYAVFWLGVGHRLRRHRRAQGILTIDVAPRHVTRHR
jgi:hypothetical protein